ncbi:carboxypeptidase-like regulatory domain-containing protein [Leptolyngbya sp. 7M]|uniref:carboxypeptidase-like regulatory domain-containing protein n=1 Tax=Leptolyngbya sp. 7M TaxID=2812896 RepID=UPI001B8B4772|nr:carboxypeptidase-like regulatory domain-containing protein [Leptolyngbya sp. 7M]QYO65853.1 carboxypeptidase-like regulatory domain-containing protein [Leptolyngbya sp. 7M]
MKRITTLQLLVLLCVTPLASQSFEITQYLLASGGGSSTGGQFSVTGSIGQPIAGRSSAEPPYQARGGFWQFDLTPTSAPVSISGRVLTDRGLAISLASVTVTDMQGSVRQAISNSFGYFRFEGLRAGEHYVLAASHRQYHFNPVMITAMEDVTDARLVASGHDVQLNIPENPTP